MSGIICFLNAFKRLSSKAGNEFKEHGNESRIVKKNSLACRKTNVIQLTAINYGKIS